MSREAAISGNDGPVILQRIDSVSADINHRFDGQGKTFCKLHAPSRSSEIRYLGGFVQFSADTMTHKCPDNTESLGFYMILNH